jgi:molybdopterin-containing oxidoreductase family iron-sulfur binding subunit
MANDSQRPLGDPGAPRWWQSLDELPSAAADEFAEELPIEIGLPGGARVRPDESSRRDFFKVMGLSATAAMAACRRAPEQKIYPFTRKPDELTPGAPLWYATACGACPARCGLLVKARDGRPIKIEGNPAHPVSKGAVCAIGQASLLGLYDDDRARRPTLSGNAATWSGIDAAVKQALAAAETKQRAVRLVVPWGLGPTAEAALDDVLARHRGARVVRFDPLGQRDAIAAASEALYGARLVPDYRLDAADVVVSFDADFLGTWLGPAHFGRQWSEARDAGRARRLHHAQIESNLSVTGGVADERYPLPPSGTRASLARLVSLLADSAPLGTPIAVVRAAAQELAGPGATLDDTKLDRLARTLRAVGPRGLVLSGSDDPAEQLLAALANALLVNATTTAIVDGRLAMRAGEMTIGALAAELAAGEVEAVLFLGTNPALVDARIAAALPRVPFSLSTSDRLDETAARCKAHAPAGHWLEAWTDDRPRADVEVMAQPLVGRLFETRPLLASLLAWGGPREDHAGTSDHAFLQARWHLDGLVVTPTDWDAAVRDGVVVREVASPVELPARALDVRAVSAGWAAASFGSGAELVLYPSVALGDGTGATSNNGWLQELPDPISKVTWGNYAALAPARARALGVDDGDLVELRAGGRTLRLPALRQPGLPEKVVAVALGHGRLQAGKIALGHGADAWPLAEKTAFGLRRAGMAVTVARAGGNAPLALTQTHASQEGRELVREVRPGHRLPVVQEPKRDPKQGEEKKRGLWPGHTYDGHRWGLSIDLDKCTGCGACVVSCSAENNIPIVGELEVRRRREMHWMRIDRYYGGSPEEPEVAQQPMLCQHCENAPCETVCPVLATVHSSEGLNQQIYNRCVGTRYCANNCPTKVRRFNWFDYDHGGDLRRMVLNPDVVVRSRGVMEKCSMCVQRIEEARAAANREGRHLADGDIRTACQQSCPSQAIVFGDSNDPKSGLSRQRGDGRAYHILEELNVKPQVTYLARVDAEKTGGQGG